MQEGLFRFEDCLLKHYVRVEGWLPVCKSRHKSIRASAKKGGGRRLRYFTFCAVGAIDVLMLDVERILRPSKTGKFDFVCFFDRDEEYVAETHKRIPGAVGFPGDFIEIVSLHDPGESSVVDELAPLESPLEEIDILETQIKQRQVAQRRKFIQQFPFDVINLDLEAFLFKPTENLPGRMVNALRKVFEWQRRPLTGRGKGSRNEKLQGFSLMFTTQIGPANLGEPYLEMLSNYLKANCDDDSELRSLLSERVGVDDPAVLRSRDFEEFLS